MVMKHALWTSGILSLILCAGCERDGAFSLQVIPPSMEAVVGRRCVFLVQPRNDQGSGRIAVSAHAPGCEVSVEYSPVADDGVAEVTVIPDSTCLPDTVAVLIEGARGPFTDTVTASVAVVDGFAVEEETALPYRDLFIPWLAQNHPELGIDSTLSWTGTSSRPNIIIVSHYLFFSERWELGLMWHVMAPPDDWARIYLRERGREMAPSRGFEISSVLSGDLPHASDPPDTVDR